MIGAAYTPVWRSVGGICHRRQYTLARRTRPAGYYSLNVVLLTQQLYGVRLIHAVVSQAATHELGHAFGALHDEDFVGRRECLPDTNSTHGVYTMSGTVSVSKTQFQAHNYMFSRCSAEKMWPIVVDRGTCLEARPASYCGNAVVEPGEQCDCGTTYSCPVHDKCCIPLSVLPVSAGPGSPQPCRLTQQARCSPRVQRCCTDDCAVARAGVTCRQRSKCSSQSRCDGQSPSCPAPTLTADNTSCAGGRGRCRSGVCSMSPCQQAGLVDCLCRRPFNHACSVCCRCASAPDDVCVPAPWLGLGPPSLLLPGSTCVSGQCDNDGQCVQSPTTTLIRRV